MKSNSFTIYFFDGTYQVINPSDKFEIKFKRDLCDTIANGRKYSLTTIF